MSYILDALKKADAERELGAVPHLHAQGHTDPPGSGAARLGRRTGVVVGAALGFGLISAGLWWALRPSPAIPPPVAVVITAPAAVAAAQAPPLPPSQAVPVVAMPAPRPPPVAAKATLPTLESLPPETRRELPPLAVGGAIYSPQASARVLIVNGQLLHEGDTIAPGLVLVAIGPKSAQMRWHDVRFSVGY